MVEIHAVDQRQYHFALECARTLSDLVADSTSAPHEIVANVGESGQYFLTSDAQSGFAVSESGEFVGLFSLVKGRGNGLVAAAIDAGATHLDCFDGYLPTLYARHGFREVYRVANWTLGDPDVVYMAL